MKSEKIQTPRTVIRALTSVLIRLADSAAVVGDGHHKPNRRIILPSILAGLALFWGIVDRSQASVVVESRGATVAGKTIGAWSAVWWQWAAALAPPGDPFTDGTGEFANVNQSGPVFLLAGSPGGSNSRQFNVPADAYLLVPLLVGELSQLELGFNQTAAQIREAARQQANQIDSLHATFDGTPIPQATLFAHREVSPNFSFVAVSGNVVGIFAEGPSGIAVADGYFLMLGPLTPGTHVLNYGGGASAYGVFIDETDTVTVAPPVLITAPNLSGVQFSFAVTGPSDATVIIEASTDLSNWQEVGRVVLSNGSNSFTSPVQGDGQEFFRASAAP